ncbi:MAG: LamG domain-containing protein [Phycisphaerales bacterium]|nr:MAG: LamG domain-containing protein [Phycisphaerales bacterium]
MKKLAIVLLLMVGLFMCSRAEATVMTYNGWARDNDNIPSFTDNAGDNYGSRINSSLVTYTGDATISAQFEQGNGWTPNIVVTWAGGQPDNWDTYTGWRDAEVAQVQGSSPGNPQDVVFTPDAGYGVLINSFDLDEWAGGGGCVVNWEVLDDTGTLASGTWTGDTAGFRSTVYTGLTEDDVNAGMAVTLRFMQTAGDGTYLAMDDTNFDQFVAESAAAPSPANGSIYEDTWVTLAWGPGAYAVSHDVYMADNFDDVNDGAASAFQGNHAIPFLTAGFFGYPIPDGLVPGTTYYWRVDEINEADPNSPWKGDVWSFWIPPKKAYEAVPDDGAKFLPADVTLEWTAGFGAKLHTVYLGDNFDDVNSASGGAAQAATTFAPGTLELGKTYYWRVDELDPPVTHKGDVWSFTTLPDVPISDPDLIGWWTFDEGGGKTAVDWSGHGNNGTVAGDPEWVDGIMKGALDLANDYVVIDGVVDDITSTNITLSLWIKSKQTNQGDLIAANDSGSGHPLEFYIESGRPGRYDGGDTTYTNAPVVADGRWHMMTYVREGNTGRIYVDGVEVATDAASFDLATVTRWSIGQEWDSGPSNFYIGMVDDVRFYNKALTAEQIAEVMRGDTKLAANPVPGLDAIVDIRDITSLSWSAGDTAVSHDVYFGTDRDAVAGANNASPEFQGNQAGASLPLATLVELGGGDYYWRIDEVEADGTVDAGTIWKFTVPDHLIVDNFESYNDIDPPDPASNTIFGSWLDGYGVPTNGAITASDLPPYAELVTVHTGVQSMRYDYDTNMMISESTLTVTRRDWTERGVTKLSLWFRGAAGNAAERMFIALNGTAVVYHDDPAATQMAGWNQWVMDLAAFGIDLTNVSTMTIGFGTKNAPAAGGTGTVYFDNIGLIP